MVVVGAGIDPGAGSAARIALHSPVVQACSRAAWALGVRIGMTATSARALSPELRVVSADPQLERDTVRAVADVLLGASAVVDPGGRVGAGGAHLALYCEVPSKTRGTSFGERLIDRLAELGLTGRIGIADDRFTAWVAASHGGEGRVDDAGVVSVPRGGSAAFLAPRPLSLLAISPEVLHMLEALGVRTLGEFAALPAPSVARPFEADYQALARGDSGSALRPYAPDAPIREEAAISAGGVASAAGSSGVLSGPAAIAVLASRIAARLAGRGRGAARLEVTTRGEAGERVVPISLAQTRRVLDSAEELAEAIGGAIEDLGAAWRLQVVVTGEALAGDAADPAAAPSVDPSVASAGASSVDSAGDAIEAPAAMLRIADQAEAERAQLATLGVVLSSTGGAWNLTSPMLRAERRDAHRRTQHGKRRTRAARASAAAMDALAQPRLFKS